VEAAAPGRAGAPIAMAAVGGWQCVRGRRRMVKEKSSAPALGHSVDHPFFCISFSVVVARQSRKNLNQLVTALKNMKERWGEESS